MVGLSSGPWEKQKKPATLCEVILEIPNETNFTIKEARISSSRLVPIAAKVLRQLFLPGVHHVAANPYVKFSPCDGRTGSPRRAIRVDWGGNLSWKAWTTKISKAFSIIWQR